ncbi:secretory carrier-associated membrane protein 1 [Meleagris gallopavo]|uniref:secretory carrier-associated membrane protein 1 n=1 Tax=Meleagris gallopavo TaxID=9103 RepID=UPI0012AC0919|nr:secretory carrier-associated membrane protein 1 [Meleagris gallopavo]
MSESPVEKELGVVVNEKFAENQQCTFVGWKACSTLGCIKKLVTGREMEMTVPFVLRPGMGLPEQEGHRAVGDPSVTQVTRNVPPGLDEYNPFSDSRTAPPGNVKMSNVPSTQPAIMKPTEEPPAYTQIAKEHALAQAELLKRQEELERKAAELDRREREMQNLNQQGGRKNNWPPLPENFPVGPCFYQDFSVDIPVEFQKTVKIMYYLWMFHTVTLFLNIFGCLAWFYVDATRGVDFGLSILWFLLFTPCSFVCWYRPLYGAFRSDSSFRFFVFFFVYICQFAVHVLQAAGFQRWGNCYLLLFHVYHLLMKFTKTCRTSHCGVWVHGLYRTTGASFEKAQQEFATGVMSNKTVQTAAANAASTAATSAAQNAFKGNRM